MYEGGTSHELARLHPVVKRNTALAVSELLPESPTLSMEELLTAAHDIMHGLTELLTPAHGPERMAGEVVNTTKTPDTSSAVKSATLRIANGCRADCAQVRRAREERKRGAQESGEEERGEQESVQKSEELGESNDA